MAASRKNTEIAVEGTSPLLRKGKGKVFEESSEKGIKLVKNGNHIYKIMDYIGDISPCCQVFKAGYYKSELFNSSREPQIVALKIARVDRSESESKARDWLNLKKEVVDSISIDHQNASHRKRRNSKIAGRNIVAINSDGFYNATTMTCYIPMQYFKEGSLRYIISKRISDRKLSEECISVVLRETLRGICYLHREGIVHKKLHAGNIFVGDNPVAIKLGYEGSAYFHKPEAYRGKKIWDDEISLAQIPLLYPASRSKENLFWATREFYEPSFGNPVSPASDIWNLGLIAIELAFGPLEINRRFACYEDNVRAVLRKETAELPTLYDIFVYNRVTEDFFGSHVTEEDDQETTKESGTEKMKKNVIRAGEKVKMFKKKVKAKIFGRKKSEQAFSGSFVTMVKRCLVLDPDKRPNAKTLLKDPFFKDHKNVDLQHFADVVLRNQATSSGN